MNKSRYSEDLTQFTNVLQIGNDRENFKVADFFFINNAIFDFISHFIRESILKKSNKVKSQHHQSIDSNSSTLYSKR